MAVLISFLNGILWGALAVVGLLVLHFLIALYELWLHGLTEHIGKSET